MYSLYSILFDEKEMESSIPSYFNKNKHISECLLRIWLGTLVATAQSLSPGCYQI